MNNTISAITTESLCTGCGACEGVCPNNCIKIVSNKTDFLIADIDNEKCIRCGLCYEVCPSNGKQLINLDNSFFKGDEKKAFIGYSNNDFIRKESQSGGLITGLLVYMREKDKIKGAYINKYRENSSHPKVCYETSVEEIIKGSGSYYTQSSVVSEILKNPQENSAAVMLGCQAEAILNLKQKFKDLVLPQFIFGLFCVGQNSGMMYSDLVNKSRLRPEKVKSFRYKSKEFNGWPGDTVIKTETEVKKMSQSIRKSLKPVYECYRCITCYDKANLSSDIVFGDPWHLDIYDAKKGWTVAIARTKKGLDLLLDAQKDGCIYLESIDINKVYEGAAIGEETKVKVGNCMKIFQENNWRFPYMVKDDDLWLKNNKTDAKLKNRLEYARKLYEEKDTLKIQKLIMKKKKIEYLKFKFNNVNYYIVRLLKIVGLKRGKIR